MNQLEAMRVFMRVAELGSFTAAANQLHLPKASVSNAVRQLEDLLETRLLHRTTRKTQITQDGQVFFGRCQTILEDIEELQGLFRQPGTPLQGRLRVDMPLPIARDLVLPNLPEFLRRHPQLAIEINSSDRFVDLVQEGFDCVLRVGELQDSSLIARPLGSYRMINCASTSYIAQYGIPQQLADLSQHRLIHYSNMPGAPLTGFEYQNHNNETINLNMRGAVTVNNTDTYLTACRAGLGIIQVPEPGVRPYLESGELISILPDYLPAPMPVYILYASRHHLPQRVREFMQWLEQLVRSRLTGTT